MGRKLVAPTPSAALDLVNKGYVDGAVAALTAAQTPKNPSVVGGTTDTLKVPGLWIELNASGVPINLYFDDTGSGGGNSDGSVAAGVTNPLAGAGIWVRKDSSGNYIGLYYDDGNH